MPDVYELEGVIVDAETGEIIESDGDPLERIIAAGLEAGDEIKRWERYQKAMKFAARQFLTGEHPKTQTPAGVAKLITQNRRSAKPAGIPDLLSEFELTETQVAALYECARDLDPALLDRLAEDGTVPGDVVDALVTTSQVTYVQFDALRKAAPTPREVTS